MAGDPPEFAQDNPPPVVRRERLPPHEVFDVAGAPELAVLRLIPPGLILAVFFVLILSAVFYAALPYRRRAYVPILVMTAVGFALGQLWDYLGLPSVRAGQANVLPAALFALVLQPLAHFLRRPPREPREPEPSNPPTRT